MGLFRKRKPTHDPHILRDRGRMDPAIRALIVEDDEDDYLTLCDLLAEIEHETFEVTWAASYEEAVERIRDNTYDIHLLDHFLGTHTGLELLSGPLERGVKAPAILLSGANDRELDLEAMKLGAASYLSKAEMRPSDVERAVRYAIEGHKVKLELAQSRAPAAGTGTRIISFIGATGGNGVTTSVANTAYAMLRQRTRVTAIDLRGGYGALAQHVALTPTGDIGMLQAKAPQQVEPQVLSGYLLRHTCGLRLLASPQNLDHYCPLSASFAKSLVAAAATEADTVLLDLPNDRSDATRAAIEISDTVVMVTDREPTTLRPAELLFEQIDRWGFSGASGVVVIDRSVLPTDTSARDIAVILGREFFAYVASAKEVARQALTAGEPAVSSSASHFVSQAYVDLATRLFEIEVDPASVAAAR